MMQKIPIQNVWEISGHVFDDSAKETEEFFRSQLHDFSI
jgi:hypothetical protein